MKAYTVAMQMAPPIQLPMVATAQGQQHALRQLSVAAIKLPTNHDWLIDKAHACACYKMVQQCWEQAALSIKQAWH